MSHLAWPDDLSLRLSGYLETDPTLRESHDDRKPEDDDYLRAGWRAGATFDFYEPPEGFLDTLRLSLDLGENFLAGGQGNRGSTQDQWGLDLGLEGVVFGYLAAGLQVGIVRSANELNFGTGENLHRQISWDLTGAGFVGVEFAFDSGFAITPSLRYVMDARVTGDPESFVNNTWGLGLSFRFPFSNDEALVAQDPMPVLPSTWDETAFLERPHAAESIIQRTVVLFPGNESEIPLDHTTYSTTATIPSNANLDRLGSLMAARPDLKILMRGLGSSFLLTSRNNLIVRERLINVRDYLIIRFGISEDRLVMVMDGDYGGRMTGVELTDVRGPSINPPGYNDRPAESVFFEVIQ